MKLSVAIAGENALPSAFVVWRGFEHSIKKASEFGYDGIELALKYPEEIDTNNLQALLDKYHMEVSCISTGQVFADTGLMFTDPNPQRRNQVKEIFKGMIDLAADYSQMVNIGRIRGKIEDDGKEAAEQRFIETASELCDYANPLGVTLILEPVNRYEINFINSVEEGVDLLNKMNKTNLKLMPDVFHMNIEDRTIGGELAKYIEHIAYIHIADSNRLAPGQGHTDFQDIFLNLKQVKYRGWMSIEILPKPEPDTAALQAAQYLRKLMKQMNIH
jgi:5-keto-L-gluconate epimerase